MPTTLGVCVCLELVVHLSSEFFFFAMEIERLPFVQPWLTKGWPGACRDKQNNTGTVMFWCVDTVQSGVFERIILEYLIYWILSILMRLRCLMWNIQQLTWKNWCLFQVHVCLKYIFQVSKLKIVPQNWYRCVISVFSSYFKFQN